MKAFFATLLFFTTFALYADGKPATLKVFDITIPKAECKELARQVANRYADSMRVTFDGPIITFKEKYKFAINCLEEHNVVHIFTDKTRNKEHQAIFDDFIKTFEKINQSTNDTGHPF